MKLKRIFILACCFLVFGVLAGGIGWGIKSHYASIDGEKPVEVSSPKADNKYYVKILPEDNSNKGTQTSYLFSESVLNQRDTSFQVFCSGGEDELWFSTKSWNSRYKVSFSNLESKKKVFLEKLKELCKKNDKKKLSQKWSDFLTQDKDLPWGFILSVKLTGFFKGSVEQVWVPKEWFN
jgi:hypothetical protein